MSITKALNQKDVAADVKLTTVAEIVAGARKAYGNEEAEIKSPLVNTTNGSMEFEHLDDESKVKLLKSEVGRVKAQAIENARNNEGVKIDKEIEKLVATNPLFTNIQPGTKFEYL